MNSIIDTQMEECVLPMDQILIILAQSLDLHDRDSFKETLRKYLLLCRAIHDKIRTWIPFWREIINVSSLKEINALWRHPRYRLIQSPSLEWKHWPLPTGERVIRSHDSLEIWKGEKRVFQMMMEVPSNVDVASVDGRYWVITNQREIWSPEGNYWLTRGIPYHRYDGILIYVDGYFDLTTQQYYPNPDGVSNIIGFYQNRYEIRLIGNMIQSQDIRTREMVYQRESPINANRGYSMSEVPGGAIIGLKPYYLIDFHDGRVVHIFEGDLRSLDVRTTIFEYLIYYRLG